MYNKVSMYKVRKQKFKIFYKCLDYITLDDPVTFCAHT